MASVWIIEVGSYSNYRVVGIYSTEENAKLVADKLNSNPDKWDEFTIGKRTLDPLVYEINEGLNKYDVYMDRDGYTRKIDKSDIESYDISTELHTVEDNRFYRVGIRGAVFAKDEAHAIKIANEFRAQMIATGKL